ncbi:MAG TPA: DNA-binding response regulator [Clostridiales bacterium]|nr:DNA-binding response regulator [Clostridiales bacterium]HBJ17057.1 DNA-binding response regulator [Clostridiales bacterium]
MRILLVEDEKPLSAAICKVLRQENYLVDPVYTGTDGLEYILSGVYDGVILDVMLPGMDGFTLLQTLREKNISTPVLMLTARGGLEDRLTGLQSGADYYLPKPFDFRELLACLNAITRRSPTLQIQELSFGDIILNQDSSVLSCTKTGQSVKLGTKEYQLMELFLRNPKQLLPRETIIERVWGFEDEAEYNNLSVYLSFLRRKMSFVGTKTEIKALRGRGYRLEEGQ